MDVVVIVTISLLAEAGHFAIRQGRHLITADSVQYVDGASALLNGEARAHFDFRKPGYSFVLAGTQLVFGNMAWGAVVINYLFQSLLPLAAYSFGRLLHSRPAGWLAALFVVAMLQTSFRAERIMSEVVYATIASFGLLAAVWAIRGRAAPAADRALADSGTTPCVPIVLSGLLLGSAWFIRASAAAPIAAVALVMAGLNVRFPSRLAKRCVCFLGPVAAFVLLECAVNQRFCGAFRPGTGTLGPATLMRARAYLDLPLAGSESGELLSLLPERSPADAFAANRSDTWVAWYRARHDRGMTEWQTDELMRNAGRRALLEHPLPHLAAATRVFGRYLLRPIDRPAAPETARLGPILPADPPAGANSPDNAYLPWALPLRDRAAADALVADMQASADDMAPFGGSGLWPALRYVVMHPWTTVVFGWIRALASIWPGLAIILALWLRLDLRVCALLATAYVIDGLIVANITSSESDLARYACVWLATDASLTAAGLCAAVTRVLAALRSVAAGPAQAAARTV